MRTVTPITGVWMKVTNPGAISRKRKRLNYTQVDLAGLVGCTQQYISLLENGRDSDCSERIALAICKRLDLDMEDVFEERQIFSATADTRSKVADKPRRAA